MAQRRMLTAADREEISRGIAEQLDGKEIAARIGRCPSVVCREIARHGRRYRAVRAGRAAVVGVVTAAQDPQARRLSVAA